MGELELPGDALYGANSARAQRNFPISELRFSRPLIRALGLIKQQAAVVNCELGLLDERLARAIEQAAQEVIDGELDSAFIVDVFQTGSGTSTNMNANEVISNRAIQLLGGEIGSRTPVHPNDHVNMGQSSNDVIPTAMQMSAALCLKNDLVPALATLESSLRAKAKEFWPIVKTGRTHLQDATPIRLGQEFLGWAGQVQRAQDRLRLSIAELSEVALGGTAVGTGINTHPDFSRNVLDRISNLVGLRFTETDNHFQAQSNLDTMVATSGALRGTALALYTVANNIRVLSCGPRAGIGELALPAVQPGSSIMPGKVNPVILESLMMVCGQVVGNDASTAFAGGQGSILELNVMMPLAAHNVLESISLLKRAARNTATQCIDDIQATARGPELVEHGLMMATALAPRIGYDAAASIAKEALSSNRTIREVARERTELDEAELTRLLNPESMTGPMPE